MEMIFIDEQGDTVQDSIKYTLLYRFESKIKVNRYIQQASNNNEYTIDVIGSFLSIGSLNHLSGGTKQNIPFELEDIDYAIGSNVNCLLWGTFAEYILQRIQDIGVGPYIVVIQFATTEIKNGEVQVSNHWHSSRVLINEDIPAINEFKSSLIRSKQNSGQVMSQKSSQSSYSMEDDFIRKTVRKNLDELSDTNEPGKYVVLATIKGLVKTSKWCYKVEVIVMDDTNSASMIVFGKEAERMLDIPVEALIQTVQNRGEEPVEYPMELEGLIDRIMLFKIAIKGDNVANEDHKTYNVQKVCTDHAIIASFLKHYEMDADSGTCSNFNDGVVDGDITTNGIVDDDVNAITPMKRSNNCILDSILNDPTVQQSSTKLLKKIKQEKME
ncbi:PREDICTED: uncharacterized protein LOC105958071 [Erythranthe guttata]|uniref:uncharacterized protein LOC105958071 n=1 Tax=Erythranthe guttata TaxID=4155 RepID=UPI00064D7ED4|nr:PREDICTED: uncharacterized protein LOC105958071 [Erythranthe guttata]|eukprot:XP_012837528.1 PREDICTED: uncharacterized protein LOC105958071 [Erythranthe guttata]